MNKIVLKYKKDRIVKYESYLYIIYAYYILTILFIIIIGITSEWVLKKGKLLINKYNNII